MAEEFNLDEYVLLLLLVKYKQRNDSYSINKILSWKFGIINLHQISTNLESKEFIKKTLEKGIHYYEITPKGFDFYEKHYTRGINVMIEKFDNIEEFTRPT